MSGLIVILIFTYIFSMVGGVLLGKLLWTPPGQGWRKYAR